MVAAVSFKMQLNLVPCTFLISIQAYEPERSELLLSV